MYRITHYSFNLCLKRRGQLADVHTKPTPYFVLFMFGVITFFFGLFPPTDRNGAFTAAIFMDISSPKNRDYESKALGASTLKMHASSVLHKIISAARRIAYRSTS